MGQSLRCRIQQRLLQRIQLCLLLPALWCCRLCQQPPPGPQQQQCSQLSPPHCQQRCRPDELQSCQQPSQYFPDQCHHRNRFQAHDPVCHYNKRQALQQPVPATTQQRRTGRPPYLYSFYLHKACRNSCHSANWYPSFSHACRKRDCSAEGVHQTVLSFDLYEPFEAFCHTSSWQHRAKHRSSHHPCYPPHLYRICSAHQQPQLQQHAKQPAQQQPKL